MNKITHTAFSNFVLKLEKKVIANNYKSLPVVISKGQDVHLWDTNGKKYIDFLSSYSANNQGHCHPKILDVMKRQASQLTLTSRAFHNNKLGMFGKIMTETFNYDKVLPMNTGVEAGETAVKIARKWGYEKKDVDKNKANIIFPNNNFWGRTVCASATQAEIEAFNNFGPFPNGLSLVDYNNLTTLEEQLKLPNTVAYFMEPIQGEAGVIIPDDNYLTQVRKLCNKYNVLMIADEVQTGMGRTGKLFACQYENVKPDILILGKALSGGFYPVSAVLADDNVMDVITPGTHGSTFGGNPLGCAVAIKSLNVLLEENMIENSYNIGKYFRENISCNDIIIDVRGKGLMNAVEIIDNKSADNIVNQLAQKGFLCKVTRGNIIRLSPPLTITKNHIDRFLETFNKIIT